MSPEIRATYRVQLHKDFGFDDVVAIVPYLARLGISHVYCSPYLQARPGSTHGYDVVDQSRISDELGGPEAHERMCEVLAEHGMSHILDVVPNHMTVTDRANGWWWDVLKHGPASHFASYFDIDWDPPEEKLRRTILVPILGDHYGRVLASGDIHIEREGDEELVRYFDHVLPVAPGSTGGRSPEELNADPDLLHEVLERQHYRLAYWHSAGEELNYRRFFSINDLAALRMDNPDVFDRVHELVLRMVKDGRLEGLRVDHVDGLRDPEGYLTQLRSWCPDAYLVVEKILEPGERLRPTWPVEGTTGYDFLNLVLGVFVDPDGEEAFDAIYRDFISDAFDLEDLKHDNKMLLMVTELSADIERLTELFASICREDRDRRDHTRNEMRDALREAIACFPVYRTYVSSASGRVTDDDVRYVTEAIRGACARRPDLEPLLAFLRQVLLLETPGEDAAELAARFQQTSGPVMAKGVEDTVFYVYNRFAALNEVGGDPGRFGHTAEHFHDAMREAQRLHPMGMVTTSTHDTKRSEDVRARLALLSERPDEWRAAVDRWREINDRHRRGDMPDRNIEYLLYQNLVGAWPLDADRAVAYAEKAAKEAKAHTSWIDPNPDYDAALRDFVGAIMADNAFVSDVDAFVTPLVGPGRSVALAQTLLKLTAPGVPDIYQGTERWDLSLVDPDNRRPVDHAALDRSLSGMASAEDALSRWDEGGPKLFVIRETLRVRRQRAAAFGRDSRYEPLSASGARSEHVLGYIRGDEVAVLVPRLVLRLENDWRDTSVVLPQGRWTDELAGGTHEGECLVGRLFERFPVALLTRAR